MESLTTDSDFAGRLHLYFQLDRGHRGACPAGRVRRRRMADQLDNRDGNLPDIVHFADFRRGDNVDCELHLQIGHLPVP